MGVFELMVLWLGGFLLMMPVKPFTFSRRLVRPPLRGGFSLSVCLSGSSNGVVVVIVVVEVVVKVG